MDGVSRLVWGIALVVIFLTVSIVTIVEVATEIVAGRHILLYLMSIFGWAPIRAIFIAWIGAFFLREDFSAQ